MKMINIFEEDRNEWKKIIEGRNTEREENETKKNNQEKVTVKDGENILKRKKIKYCWKLYESRMMAGLKGRYRGWILYECFMEAK